LKKIKKKNRIVNMIVLAIETSCDDTCVAIVKIEKGKNKILSNIVSSQVKLHAKYGGVYPFLAKREHQKNLPLVFKKAKKEAKNPKIDLIVVTSGPGLEPCLWTGINFAQSLAQKNKLPLVSADHVESHILANFLENSINHKLIFPAVCLIVSGGHTQLVLAKDIGKYQILGETRDDAAGECFDKTARILGLGYPGGPVIAWEAKNFSTSDPMLLILLPRPMIHQKNYDFSFSGLKTAVLYDFKSRPEKIKKSKYYIREMAKEIQQSIIDVLISKTLRAAKEKKAKSIILGGGVAANEELRRQFKQKAKSPEFGFNFLVPPQNLCTDNAAMVALAGYFQWQKNKKKKLKEIEADANLKLEN